MRRHQLLLISIASTSFFFAGWAFGATAISERVTSGLVQAMHSVGANLFGTQIFAAGIIDPGIYPPDPINEARAVQLDFSDASEIPLVVNLFQPPDPIEPICRPYAQFVVSPSDGVALLYDPAFVDPEALEPNEPFFGHPPDPCRGDVVIVVPE